MPAGIVIAEVPAPVTTRDYGLLKKQIREMERDLFAAKAQLAAINHPSGKHVLQTPNLHRCATCGNGRCLNHAEPKDVHPGTRAALTAIRNSTAMWGCLGWLPKGCVFA